MIVYYGGNAGPRERKLDRLERPRAWPALVLLFVVLVSAGACAVISPAAESATKCQPAQAIAVGKPIAGRYKRTHGQKVSSTAAPYVEEYAELNNIDLGKVMEALFPSGTPKPTASDDALIYLSSYQHINRKNGTWTYVQSGSILLYEILEVRIGQSPPVFILLHTRTTPDRIVLDTFDADWYLTIVDHDYKVLAEQSFATHIRHRETGLWDMIYTDLSLKEGRPVVKIAYAHTGGGGGRNQEFAYEFSLGERPSCITLLEGKQTLDEYQRSE